MRCIGPGGRVRVMGSALSGHGGYATLVATARAEAGVQMSVARLQAPITSAVRRSRILATVLCIRKIGTQTCSPGSSAPPESTLTRAIQEARPLLAEHDYAIHPSTARFRTQTDVAAYLDQYPPP